LGDDRSWDSAAAAPVVLELRGRVETVSGDTMAGGGSSNDT